MVRIKDYKLPKELEKYKEAIRDFTRNELEEIALELEKTSKLPAKLLPMLSDSGLLTLRLPKEYGGQGLTFSQYWPILVETGKSHGTIRMFIHAFNDIWPVLHQYGTTEQKKKWFTSVWLAGKGYPAFALTEPETGTGVDIKTTAQKRGDFYILNGKKYLITFADIADMVLVVAYTGDRSLGAKGISMFLVEKDTPGYSIESMGEMMGLRGCTHGVLHFNNCKVPTANLVGKEGEGLEIALRTFLDSSRLAIAASCIAPAERLLELSVDYAKTRVTFGKPIAERQVIQQLLADMATDIYAARCMVEDCARKYDAGKSIAAEASKCKLFGVGMIGRVSDNAFLVHGGPGYCVAASIERHYRDSRSLWFEEGGPSAHRTIIARDVLGKQVRSIGE